jgi:cell division protease FtsH
MDQHTPIKRGNVPPGNVPPPKWGSWILFVLMTLLLVWMWQEGPRRVGMRTISYSQFKDYVHNDEVLDCLIQQTEITGKIQPHPKAAAKQSGTSAQPETKSAPQTASPESKTGSKTPTGSTAPANANNNKNQAAQSQTFQFRTVRVTDPDLVRDLEKAGVSFTGVAPSFISEFLWAWILPIGLMVVLFAYLRKKQGLGQSVMRFGSSHAKLIADKDIHVTFDDVAGCDEAKYELQEVVEFLKQPLRYQALGAKIPKGVLLVGPPGTGKTLLARAVAGEAKVPFFSISGSEFVEMFVGVGAARVRDLFEQGKKNAPCIIFIDELDAIGRERGVRMGIANDEREQTLNQLLVGLDGFEANVGVVVLAATNRPEVLDRALLRPGRFDRQVIVDAPDMDGREAILTLHARGKPLAREANLRKIAEETPGFSGADLANVINEAALLAARHNATEITQKDLDDSVEKVVAGPERKSRRLSKQDKERVAYHEVGHALVGSFSKHPDVLRKISIVPHGRAALGYTLQFPEADQYLMSRVELIDKIKGLLGGRAAEEVVFGDTTTGAENDLQHATAIARKMVCIYGMSESVGLTHCAERPNAYLSIGGDGAMRLDCSEQTARQIDEEVKSILDQAYSEAKQILTGHRATLNLIASELLKRETLDVQAFQALMEQAAGLPAEPVKSP